MSPLYNPAVNPVREADAGNTYDGTLASTATVNGTGKLTDGFQRVDLSITSNKAITLKLQECDDNSTWVTTDSWVIPGDSAVHAFPFKLSKSHYRTQRIGHATDEATITLTTMLDPRPMPSQPFARTDNVTLGAAEFTYVAIPVGAKFFELSGTKAAGPGTSPVFDVYEIVEANPGTLGSTAIIDKSASALGGYAGRVSIPPVVSGGTLPPAYVRVYSAAAAIGFFGWYAQ